MFLSPGNETRRSPAHSRSVTPPHPSSEHGGSLPSPVYNADEPDSEYGPDHNDGNRSENGDDGGPSGFPDEHQDHARPDDKEDSYMRMLANPSNRRADAPRKRSRSPQPNLPHPSDEELHRRRRQRTDERGGSHRDRSRSPDPESVFEFSGREGGGGGRGDERDDLRSSSSGAGRRREPEYTAEQVVELKRDALKAIELKRIQLPKQAIREWTRRDSLDDLRDEVDRLEHIASTQRALAFYKWMLAGGTTVSEKAMVNFMKLKYMNGWSVTVDANARAGEYDAMLLKIAAKRGKFVDSIPPELELFMALGFSGMRYNATQKQVEEMREQAEKASVAAAQRHRAPLPRQAHPVESSSGMTGPEDDDGDMSDFADFVVPTTPATPHGSGGDGSNSVIADAIAREQAYRTGDMGVRFAESDTVVEFDSAAVPKKKKKKKAGKGKKKAAADSSDKVTVDLFG